MVEIVIFIIDTIKENDKVVYNTDEKEKKNNTGS